MGTLRIRHGKKNANWAVRTDLGPGYTHPVVCTKEPIASCSESDGNHRFIPFTATFEIASSCGKPCRLILVFFIPRSSRSRCRGMSYKVVVNAKRTKREEIIGETVAALTTRELTQAELRITSSSGTFYFCGPSSLF